MRQLVIKKNGTNDRIGISESNLRICLLLGNESSGLSAASIAPDFGVEMNRAGIMKHHSSSPRGSEVNREFRDAFQ